MSAARATPHAAWHAAWHGRAHRYSPKCRSVQNILSSASESTTWSIPFATPSISALAAARAVATRCSSARHVAAVHDTLQQFVHNAADLAEPWPPDPLSPHSALLPRQTAVWCRSAALAHWTGAAWSERSELRGGALSHFSGPSKRSSACGKERRALAGRWRGWVV